MSVTVPHISTCKTLLIVGTYTQVFPHVVGRARGMHLVEYTEMDGIEDTMTAVCTDLPMGENPSYVCVVPHGDAKEEHVSIVACNEGGRSLSWGTLTPGQGMKWQLSKDTVDVGGDAPCHVAASISGRWLCTATYCGGSVSAHRLTHNGPHLTVNNPTHVITHTSGSGVNADRQEAAHAHQALMHSPSWMPGKIVVSVADLGKDILRNYVLDEETGEMQAVSELVLPGGSGPRHGVWHPAAPLVFIVTELSNRVFVCKVSPTLAMEIVCEANIVADGCDPMKAGAGAICVSPCGRLVFASVRGEGHNYVTVMKLGLDKDGNAIQFDVIDRIGGCGSCPRDMAHHPTRPVLFVASQNDHRITAYRYAFSDGPGDGPVLSPFLVSASVDCTSPVCVVPFMIDRVASQKYTC